MKPNKGFITVLMMVLISISLSTFSRAAFDTFSDVPNDSPFHESICCAAVQRPCDTDPVKVEIAPAKGGVHIA